MKYTDNYKLKLPEQTDIYNVEDHNDNMKAIDEKLKDIETKADNNVNASGDSKDDTCTFTSADSKSPTGWTDVESLLSGEKHNSLFNKISTMFKNVRWLYKRLGSVDISTIGAGTVTSAIASLDRTKLTCSSSGISGKNARYFKFSDGTLICVHTIYVNAAITTPWGSMYESSVIDLGEWAYPFYVVPQVSISSASPNEVGTGYNCIPQGLWNKSATKIGHTQLMRPVSTVAQSYAIDVIGIGRWK